MNCPRFLRGWCCPLFLATLSVAGCAQSQTPASTKAISGSPLQQRAGDVVGLINDGRGFDEVFSPDFRAQVSAAQFAQTSAQLKGSLGRALRVQKVTATSPLSGQISVVFERGLVLMQLSVESASPHRINGLLITGTQSEASSFEAVQKELKALPGQTALSVSRLNGQRLVPLVAYHAGRSLAIGSSFKLYVLAELVRQIAAGQRHWSDVVELRESSFPSGQLQNWPPGSPLTLHTLAALMISNSDNTATDQLVATLGRERIEKMMSEAGNSDASRSLPFLKTVELFKIKGAPQGIAATYAKSSVAQRRKMLAGQIAALHNENVNFDFLAKPSYVSQIEWFASPLDLARVMNWLRVHSNAPGDKTRGILGINKALPEEEAAQWDYVGYKGGSETGVISLTFLLRSKKGQWFVVSGSWNNEGAPTEDARFIGLIQKTVQLVREGSS